MGVFVVSGVNKKHENENYRIISGAVWSNSIEFLYQTLSQQKLRKDRATG